MKIGVCGLVCEKCPKYKSKDCPGCQPNEFCPLPACAKKKGVEVCFECGDFPCQLCYTNGPLKKETLDYHKKQQ